MLKAVAVVIEEIIGGVTSLNSQTGAVTIESSSLTITNPSPGVIDIEGTSPPPQVFSIDSNNNIWSSNTTEPTGATGANFFGEVAGTGATYAFNSSFFGSYAGVGASHSSNSNFFGYRAGANSNYADTSNFFGTFAGEEANNAHGSNFFGEVAGTGATTAYLSNFFGSFAGYQATEAARSNFFGQNAGKEATYAFASNFFGYSAGYQAKSANSSNFFGRYSGVSAVYAQHSNFFGYFSGQYARNASESNFFGRRAGANATNATGSNFFGQRSGVNAVYANDAIFIGSYAGYNDTVNNSSSNTSIALGRWSGTGGFSDSIAIGHGVINSKANEANIGNVLYIDGIYASDSQSSSPVSGKVGINQENPAYALDIHDTAETGIDIGNSATGDWNISNTGHIYVQGYYSSDGSAGDTTTVTTSTLVGKTMTFKDGLLVSFA